MPVLAHLAGLLAVRRALGLQLDFPRQLVVSAASSPTRVHEQYRQRLLNQGGLGMQYTAEVSIGGQAIQGVLDTGSYELLVFSTECTSCGSTAGYYDRTRSDSHEHGHIAVSHSFGSGDTQSELAFENVTIGPMQSSRQYFWQVVGAEMPVANNGGFQAIVGVGPPSTPRTDSLTQAKEAEELKSKRKADPGFHASEALKEAYKDTVDLATELTLLENFQVSTFSVCIGRAEGSDGFFTWNEEDPRSQPEGLFTQVPVAGSVTWGLQLSQVRMQMTTDGAPEVSIGCADGCGALIDSGTSLLVLPRQAADQALQALNTLNSDCSNLDLLPKLVFRLGDSSFSLPPQSYIGQFTGELPHTVKRFAKKADDGKYRACELLIMTMDVKTNLGPMWILGLPFFREYYSTFSLGDDVWSMAGRSISFAKADDDCQPQMPNASSHSLVQKSLRRVDLSKVQVPHWVASAAAEGSVVL